jgi:XTP/dITP diphosphohydrolase
MQAVLASKNEKKLKELQEILSSLGIEVILQSQIGIDVDVEETGSSFEENALLKAGAVWEAANLPAIADDSGFVVDALGGGPGIFSARYGGPDLDDRGRLMLLLQNMRGQTKRSCRFVCAIACAFPNGDTVTAKGECEGVVAFAPQGEGGFGYDPVFFVPSMKKTMAQISPEEKHQISHRGKALRQLKTELEQYYGTDK